MSAKTLAPIATALAFAACAPKAVVVEEPRTPAEEKQPEPPVDETPLPEPGPPDDGIRLPDMLTMPENSEFRATAPNAVTTGNPTGGAVIARPPTDPPSRPKPGDDLE